MIVKNPIGLIGDVLGTFPVLQQLNKDHENFSVIVHEDAKWLYDLVPEINICTCPKWDKELNLSGAFTMSHQHNIYMTQAHYPFMGYPIPEAPVKAELTVKEVECFEFDYVIAPFGRSAPDEQKWSNDKWIELMRSMPDKNFLVLGNSKYDKWVNDEPDNMCLGFDFTIQQLCNLLLKSKYGCISIVTGISHLGYHLGVKNYLLANQGMTWGKNPSAILIEDHIPTLSVQTVYDVIHSN